MPNSRDGSFDIFYRRGFAYLRVSPPQGQGRPVYHEDVLSRMRLLSVPRVAVETIADIVQEASNTPVQLVEWPDGDRLSSEITVEVAPDRMSATLTVSPPRKGGAPPDRTDLADAIARAGVVHGVAEDELATLAADPHYDEPVTVAHGTDPIHAKSAEVRYHFDPNRGKPYLVLEFDRIDLRELNFIENKHEGDLLAELIPPVEPSDGTDVLGQPIPARTDVKQVQLRGGTNTRVSADGSRITATADGNVRIDRGAIVIEPVVKVTSVDYSTGNIRFEGSVVVEKDIADGFVVEADGDVQVGRGVGRATIKAGGNVLFKAGVNGGGEAQIACEGNLFAKYVEGATVTVHGSAFVEEAIMHSHLAVWKHCVLNGRRSEVIASTLIVGGSLWCKKLGSVSEAPVSVAVGIAPEVLMRYRKAVREVEGAEAARDRAQQELVKADRAISDGHDDERILAAREQYYQEMTQLDNDLPALKRQMHELRDYLQAARESRLVVEDTIFNGATVRFGTQEYRAPQKGARKTILRTGPEGVIEEGFNPAEKPVLEFEGSNDSGGDG